MNWFSMIHSDFYRYHATGHGETHPLVILLLTQGFWASSIYRIAHAVRRARSRSWLWAGPDIFFMFVQKWVEIFTSIELPADCQVGKGLYLGHFGPTIVNGRVQIGENCNLSQGVTIGVSQRGQRKGIPIIGNRVYIGPNAIVIGGIEIGNDVAIGAGAVVTRSVPDRAVVAGNPARILSYEGSFEMIRYWGMEQDPQRQESLAQREAGAGGVEMQEST